MCACVCLQSVDTYFDKNKTGTNKIRHFNNIDSSLPIDDSGSFITMRVTCMHFVEQESKHWTHFSADILLFMTIRQSVMADVGLLDLVGIYTLA